MTAAFSTEVDRHRHVTFLCDKETMRGKWCGDV